MMTREEFVAEMNRQLKIVRAEYGFTQENMARMLGISKKTLVEIEKGRVTLGWTGAVAFCTIFSESQVLAGALGGEASDMILALAFQEWEPQEIESGQTLSAGQEEAAVSVARSPGRPSQCRVQYPQTMGGKVWWRTVEEIGGFRIQQNIISQHYRALNQKDQRICSSFQIEQIHRRIRQLQQ